MHPPDRMIRIALTRHASNLNTQPNPSVEPLNVALPPG